MEGFGGSGLFLCFLPFHCNYIIVIVSILYFILIIKVTVFLNLNCSYTNQAFYHLPESHPLHTREGEGVSEQLCGTGLLAGIKPQQSFFFFFFGA